MKTAINISNYEEFFLLYVDGELSAADRKAVEDFASAHPDLALELDMLRQTQLSEEDLVFGDKGSLYRNAAEEISLANYEEQFLLFVDNELDAGAKARVETFVLQHPALQEQFTQLKQARLEPETILFPDKNLLYRKEEKERRVIYLNWQRLAVAAALIGLAVAVWTVIPHDKAGKESQTIAQAVTGTKRAAGGTSVAGDAIASSAPSSPREIKTAAPQTDPMPAVTSPANGIMAAVNGTSASPVAAIANDAGNANNNALPPATTQTVLASAEPTIRTEPVVTASGYNTTATGSATGMQTVTDERMAPLNQAITASNTDGATGGPNNNEVQPAVYRELDTEDEKKSLLLGSLEINKDKLRGFFRKAGSIFRSKPKADDERTESRPSSSTRSLK